MFSYEKKDPTGEFDLFTLPMVTADIFTESSIQVNKAHCQDGSSHLGNLPNKLTH